jgi:flagellar hook-basal body complex protein FliE
MIEALSAIAQTLSDIASAASSTTPSGPPDSVVPGASGAGATSFSSTLKGALDRLDGTIASASNAAKAFAAGDHTIPLSDVMVSMEQSNLALQMAANVRDKVVAAYSNVMNMQV